MNRLNAVAFGCLVAFTARSQSTAELPKFESYPAGEIFRGKPVPPVLVTSGYKLFRTMIRQAAAKGPNFAGHLTIAKWGCGSECASIAIVDATDGKVYDAPFVILGYGPEARYVGAFGPFNANEPFVPLLYQLNSRLLIARGCPEDGDCGSFFYEWTGSHFKLLRQMITASPINPKR